MVVVMDEYSQTSMTNAKRYLSQFKRDYDADDNTPAYCPMQSQINKFPNYYEQSYYQFAQAYVNRHMGGGRRQSRRSRSQQKRQQQQRRSVRR